MTIYRLRDEYLYTLDDTDDAELFATEQGAWNYASQKLLDEFLDEDYIDCLIPEHGVDCEPNHDNPHWQAWIEDAAEGLRVESIEIGD